MINENIVDRSNSIINEPIYMMHQGKLMSSNKLKIYTDANFLIVTCENIFLMKSFLQDDKRIYVLLDKNVDKASYEKLKRPNFWFIPTDLILPNLIITNEAIYHICLGLEMSIKNVVEDIYQYFLYLVQKYVGNETVLQEDVIEPETNCIEKYPSVSALNTRFGFVSNLYENTTQSIRSIAPKNNAYDKYLLLDGVFVNPLDCLEGQKLHCVIVGKDTFYLLKTGFDFDLSKYTYKTVMTKVTYEEAYDKTFYYLSNDERVEIQKEKSISVEILVDLRTENDDTYIEKQLAKKMNTLELDQMSLSIRVKVNKKYLRLTDFSDAKRLSDEELKKQYPYLNQNEISLYRSKYGTIAAIHPSQIQLLENVNVDFVVSK